MTNQEEFDHRVSYAIRCILAKDTNSRAFDSCFENWDGAFIVTAIVRQAEAGNFWPEIQAWWGSNPCPWPATAAKYTHLRDDQLAAAAAQTRKAKANVPWQQIEMIGDP